MKLLAKEAPCATCDVLVVDDDDDLREALAETLSDEGHHTRVAANGALALELLRTGYRPCAVVLDLMMPVMDGWTLLQEMRRDPALAGIDVIIASASGPLPTPMPARCVALPKPVGVDELLAAVSRACSGQCRLVAAVG